MHAPIFSLRTALVALLQASLLLTGCDDLFLTTQEKAERERERAKTQAEWEGFAKTKDNCKAVVRQNTDSATLQFSNKSVLGDAKTENGWVYSLIASDKNNQYFFTCYSDSNGNIISASKRIDG